MSCSDELFGQDMTRCALVVQPLTWLDAVWRRRRWQVISERSFLWLSDRCCWRLVLRYFRDCQFSFLEPPAILCRVMGKLKFLINVYFDRSFTLFLAFQSLWAAAKYDFLFLQVEQSSAMISIALVPARSVVQISQRGDCS